MNTGGILVIDKPAGWTSHDVVAKLRGVLGQKRVGHGGTLDPMATGVLPVFIGRATRAAEFCENAEKEYIAGLRLGITTNTQDITGEDLGRQNVSVTIDEIEAILPQFKGYQKQIPPMFSAIKKDGRKLYELARKGIVAERKARDIEVKSITLTDTPIDGSSDDFFIRVTCSKGTYIRTLCHDIGTKLGCGAALSYLRRTRAGVFTIDAAHTLDTVTAAHRDLVIPVDSIFQQYPSVTLGDTDTLKAKNGALKHLTEIDDGKYRFYSKDGEFLLFGEVVNNMLIKSKSFFEV